MTRRNKLLLALPFAVAFAVTLGAIALLHAPYDWRIASFAETKQGYHPSESWLLDRHGETLDVRRIDYKVRRLEWIALDDISPAAHESLIRSEDRRFAEHRGVDWLALASSAATALSGGKRPRGASTLTMQLASFLDPALAPKNSRRSLAQKWRQMRTALEIERRWSKREILEAYFNLASFRGETVGIHAASVALFGAHPSALNRPQSLLLAALLQGPTANPKRVAAHACALFEASRTDAPNPGGDPSCDELKTLARSALVAHELAIPQEGIAPHLAQKLLDKPSARVATTLDANLQRQAIQSLRAHLLALQDQNVRDGAVVVLDNASGDVLAYVGSSGELSNAGAVDGAAAPRLAGSTLKPFLYGMAIAEKRLTAASILDDSPIQLPTLRGLYVPQNYDRDFKGSVSMRTALASSLNVPAVRTLALVGPDAFARTLRAYGLDSVNGDGEHYGLSLALGGAEVRLVELTNAYRALANGGVWRPYGFRDGDHRTSGRRLLSAEAAYIVADILSDRSARATTFGLENPLATRVWSAVKTGTSKDMRDNWCIGFSGRYTVGVWVGNFGGEPMRDVSGVSGAAPVWRDLMVYLHTADAGKPPKSPPGVVAREVRFLPPVEAARIEQFVAGTEAAEVRLFAGDETQPITAHILYPAEGTVIAIDPDIPPRHQRVQFSSRGGGEATWLLDGQPVGQGEEVAWQPAGGRHRLALADAQGNELDAVAFEVRGAVLAASGEKP